MTKPEYAIAICRVSTDKQSKVGHSLQNQEQSAYEAAEQEGWVIEKLWSSAVSSKHGRNLQRSDIREVLAYCSRNKHIKHCILNEPTRLMRSLAEAYWFITELRKRGVEIFFVAYPELNTNDVMAQMNLMIKLFGGENDNATRMVNVRNGMHHRVKAGFFPHQPKAGYMRSLTPGLHIPDPQRFPLLKEAFKTVASGQRTAKQALTALNASGYRTPAGRKLDGTHFKIMLEDPFYMGKVRVKNLPVSDGVHQKMISASEHERIIIRISGKKPRIYQKQFNPTYPLAKLLSCGECGTIRKVTGSTSTNKQKRAYQRYICRECRKTFARDMIHDNYSELLKRVYVKPELAEKFMTAITKVWRMNNEARVRQVNALSADIAKIAQPMSDTAAAYASTTSDVMRKELERQLEQLDAQKLQLQDRLASMKSIDAGVDKFARFVAEFMSDLPTNWFELDPETRETCQKLVFPGDILIHQNGKVSTTKLSPIYRLLDTKKGTEVPSISYMVTLRQPIYKSVVTEIFRWNDILSTISTQPNLLSAE